MASGIKYICKRTDLHVKENKWKETEKKIEKGFSKSHNNSEIALVQDLALLCGPS